MAEKHMTMLTSLAKVVLTTIQEGMAVTGTLSALLPTTTQDTGLETATQAHMESSIRLSKWAEGINSAVEGPILITREVAIATAMKTTEITPLGGHLTRGEGGMPFVDLCWLSSFRQSHLATLFQRSCKVKMFIELIFIHV